MQHLPLCREISGFYGHLRAFSQVKIGGRVKVLSGQTGT